MVSAGVNTGIVVGLTGGVATGRSTVATMFRQLGACIIDVDGISREVMRHGLPAWRAIVDHFGSAVLQPDGEINRRYLGELVSANPDCRLVLNQRVYPFVQEAIDKQLHTLAAESPEGVVLVDAPYLIETGMHADMAWTLVVYAPEHVQIQRLMARDGLKEHEALARVRARMCIEEKKRLADIVIDNSGTLTQTQQSVDDIYRHLKQTRNRNPEKG